MSKYHATFSPGSSGYGLSPDYVSHRWHRLMMPKIVSKPHDTHVFEMILAMKKKKEKP